jgi:hypothetical protein
LKWHFNAIESDDDRGINESRGLACELVAWRLIMYKSHTEAIDSLCCDLPQVSKASVEDAARLAADVERCDEDEDLLTERSPLLDEGRATMEDSFYDEDPSDSEYAEQSNFAATFAGLNALEIAAVSDAKKFLSQKAIQRIIDGIWNGDIAFWDSMDRNSVKQAKVYRRTDADPYCRLRVPLFLKVFEMMFFAAFLTFYYIVLVQKHSEHISGPEVMMYIWLASFTYNGRSSETSFDAEC